MAHPSTAEAADLARSDSKEAIERARAEGQTQPIVTIADGAEHDAQTTGFHKHWWRQHDEGWPAPVREAYNETFTRELLAAQVAVVELQFDSAGGKWTNVGVVDLRHWEPTFPFDPERTGWIQQDPRSRVGWRRRSVLRDFFKKRKEKKAVPLLLALACLCLLPAAPAEGAPPSSAEELNPLVGFTLKGTNGFTINVESYSGEGTIHSAIALTARRGNETVAYTAPAQVTEDSMRADLGSLGRVDLVLHRSGRQKTLDSRCLPHPQSFEAGTWEGVVEFDGEMGFTRARATRVAALPFLALIGESRLCDGRSSGEARGPGLPGARLAGVSYADGRTFEFRFNKNRPAGKTLFNASLKERRGGIRIYRELTGVAPASAFRYGPLLRTATLAPPAPFSGSARLTRDRDSVSPSIAGDLELAFPGSTVGLAGEEVHVSLVHARLRKGEDGNISIGFARLP